MIHTNRGLVFGRDKYASTQRGCPDILAWHCGKSYAFELKSKHGRLTPEQTQWIEDLTKHGVVAFVVRDLEEVIRAFDK